jgi:hypothetical protein
MSLNKIYWCLSLIAAFGLLVGPEAHGQSSFADGRVQGERMAASAAPVTSSPYGTGQAVATTACYSSAHVAEQNIVRLYLDFAGTPVLLWPACQNAIEDYRTQHPETSNEQEFALVNVSHEDAEVDQFAPNGKSCRSGWSLGYIVSQCRVRPAK